MEITDVSLITENVPLLIRFYEKIFQTKAEGDDGNIICFRSWSKSNET